MTRLRKKYKKLKQRYEKMCSLPFVPEFKFESPKLQTFCTRKIISKQNANKAMLEYYDKTAWQDWEPEPGVCRVVDGLPNRVERIKCLGNAVVPQQFYPFFAAIAAVESEIDDGN